VAIEDLDSIRHDLDRAQSEAGLLRVHVMRIASTAAAIVDSRGCHLTAADDTLKAAHIGAEEEKGAL
jgi:hypothetical protein